MATYTYDRLSPAVDSALLAEQLAAAGIQTETVRFGRRRADNHYVVEIVTGAAEPAVAAVWAAHAPPAETVAQERLRLLTAAEANWDSLTTAQKLTAMRQAVRVAIVLMQERVLRP